MKIRIDCKLTVDVADDEAANEAYGRALQKFREAAAELGAAYQSHYRRTRERKKNKIVEGLEQAVEHAREN